MSAPTSARTRASRAVDGSHARTRIASPAKPRRLFVAALVCGGLAALAFPASVQAQWAQVNIISPANGAHFTNPTITVSYNGCSSVTPTSYGVFVNNAPKTTTFVTAGCFDWAVRRRYTASSVTLNPGANSIRAEVCHSSRFPTCVSHGITVYYDIPRVSVTPDGGTAAAINDGAGGSFGFTVTNNGDLRATANMSVACSGNLVCGPAPASELLNPGDWRTVTVSYTGSGVGSGTVSLTATYGEYPSTSDGGWVSVTVNPKPVASVSVVNNGAGTIGVGQTSSFTARTYAADGTELTGRSVAWSGSLVSVSPASGTSAATTTATGTAAGTGAVYATSEGVTGGAGVTVVNPTYSVSVTSGTSNPINTPPGATSTGLIRYFVNNTSTYTSTASTFALTLTRSGVVSSCPTLASVTLAPGQTSDPITVSCTLAGITSPTSGTVALTASTTSPTSFSSSFTHTVNATPYYAVRVVPTVASRTEPARATSGSTTFTVYNDSKGTGGTTTISLSRSCSGVAACAPPGGNVAVAEGGSTVVTVSYDVLWVGTTGSVALTAAAGGASGSGSTSIGTTPSYGVTVTPAAAAQTLPARTTSVSPSFTVRNTSTNTGGPIAFALTAACTGIASCAASQGSLTLAQDAQGTHAPGTTIALSGRSGAVSLTASASIPASFSASGSTSLTATPGYAVAVVPIEPSKTLTARTTLDSTYFRVENRSTNTDGSAVTFSLSATCSVVASCTSQPSTVSLAENAVSTNRKVVFNVSHVGTGGGVTLTASVASPTAFSGSGSSSVTPTPSYTVTVMPAATFQTLAAQSTSGSASYTVSNTSTNTAGPISFTFTGSCRGVTSCPAAQGSASIAQGASSTRTVSFTVDSVQTGGAVVLTAAATATAAFADSGSTTVNATPFYRVTVTSTSASQTLAARSTSGASPFRVKNTSWNSAGSVVFSLAASCAGIAREVGCSASATSHTLAQGQQSPDVIVTYAVDSIGTTGTAILTAAASAPAAFSGRDSTRLSATPSYTIAVVPAAATQDVGAGTPQTFTAQIKNTSWNAASPVTVSLSTPGCTNVVLANCLVQANSNSLAQGASTTDIPLTYDAIGVGRETVALNVSGTVVGSTVSVANGTLSVGVADTGTIVVTTDELNPRTTIERGDCLTIAAGQNAAYECGDLRIVHPLPTTTTMNKARTPTLIYNSRHAKPGALLAANVRYTGAPPLRLQATVTIPNQAPITRTVNWNEACLGQQCRIVVPIDVSPTMGTGLHEPTIQVKAMSNGFTYATSSSVTDTVVIVNRTTSPYGAGWWVDGLETVLHLSPQRKLWVGGDGSARLYSQSATDGTTFTVEPAYDRPDTLKQVATTWRRLLGNGAYVEFDNAGRHVRTVNALGWETRFAYKNAMIGTPLDSIILPVPSGSTAVRAYTFDYALDASSQPVLNSVTAPAASFPRMTSFAHASHFWITGVTDPDGHTTTFGYDSPGRLTRRQNKLNDTTYFAYDDGGALKQVTLGMSRTDGAGAKIVTAFRAAETRSAYDAADRPTPLAKAYTLFDGPRADDVGDTTTFIVSRWGAPDTVRNALGHRTRVRRALTTSFPGLATESFGPTGLESRAHYNGVRALLDSVEVVDPYDRACTDRSCNAITHYTWHPVWNHVQTIVGPTGEPTTIFYSALRPLPDSIQTGSSPNRRAKIRYYPSGQVASVTEPGATASDSVVYDALGNVTKTVSPMGFVTEHLRDGIGRDTLTITPTDSAQTPGLRTRTRTIYNARDLVDSTMAIGAATSYTLHFVAPDTARIGADTLFTMFAYDAEGRLTSTTAAGTAQLPNPEQRVVRTVESLTLDAAGRVRVRNRNQAHDSTYYDEAGNVKRVATAGGGGYTQDFDALNRVTRRIVAEKTYPRMRCQGMLPGSITDPFDPAMCLVVFPAYPTASDGSYTIRADTARFTYDTLGNILTAVNFDARIQRAYFRNGALKRDSVAYRVPNGYWLGNDRIILHSYDLAGRRDTLTLPGGGKIRYAYRTGDDGALARITDPYETPYRFVYDLAGRVDSLVIGADGVREKRWYDADGHQVARARERYHTDPMQRSLGEELLSFDAQGRVIRSAYWTRANGTGQDTTYLAYSGLGAVLMRERTVPALARWEVEEFRVDGLGNVLRTRTRNWDQTPPMPEVAVYSVRGALTGREGLPNPESEYEYNKLQQSFDADGQQIASHHYARDRFNSVTVDNPTRSYYGRDGKLRAVQRYAQASGSAAGTWEEYRYDALGRRVMVVARPGGSRPPACDTLRLTYCAALCTIRDCGSKVTTTIWDGSQVLREEREPYPGGSWTEPYYGTIEYVHGPELDKPLATLDDRVTGKVRVLNPNWRGLFESSVTPDGAGADCSVTGGACSTIAWPAGQAVYQRPRRLDIGGVAPQLTWAGTLLTDGQDGTGQLYRRNRYYDPDAGRFTQEDPIGLAGGLNLYGYAGGDPINYSDPSGLTPCLIAPPVSIYICIAFVATVAAAGTHMWEQTRQFVKGWDAWRKDSEQDAEKDKPATPPPAATPQNPDKSQKEPGQQYEEITDAQRRARQKQQGERIRSTQKSKQRDRQEIRDEAEEALEELRRRRQNPQNPEKP